MKPLSVGLPFRLGIVVAILTIFTQGACNNAPRSIPFPPEDSAFHLVKQTLRWSAPHALNWDERDPRRLKPLFKKFVLGRIPATVFDQSGYHPFSKPPDESRCSWDSLPSGHFDLDRLPAIPLKTTSVAIMPTSFVRAGKPRWGATGIEEFPNDPSLWQHIFYFLRDRTGLMWLATDKGLYQYDGENLRSYPISVKGTYELTEDSTGRIWMAGYYLDLLVLDPTHGTLTTIYTDKGLSFKSIDAHVQKVICDRHGNMWATTYTNGVYVVNMASSTIKNISTAQGLSENFVIDALLDHNGAMWLATLKGIDIVDPRDKTMKFVARAQGLSGDFIAALKEDSKGRMLISTFVDPSDVHFGHVDILDLNAGNIKHLSSGQGYHGNAVLSICQNSRGDFLLGTWFDGIQFLNLDSLDFKQLNTKNGLNDNDVLAMARDSTDVIWVSTAGGELILGQMGFDIHHVDTKGITSMVEDTAGLVWILYQNAGADAFDPRSGLVKPITVRQGLSSNLLQNATIDAGKIYISSWGGLDILDPGGQTLEHLGKAQGLRSDSVLAVMVDDESRLWIAGTGKTGIQIIDPESKRIKDLDTPRGLSDNNISDFKVDHDNNIWVSTYFKGIDVIDPKLKTIKHLLNGGGLQEMANKVLRVDSLGHVWIGTGSGLYIADLANNSLFSFPSNLFPAVTVNSLNWFDGRMYAGTYRGLKIIVPPTQTNHPLDESGWRVETIGPMLGFKKSVVTYMSDLMTKKGELWWGDSGVTILHKVSDDEVKQRTIVTDIDFLNEQFCFFDTSGLPANKRGIDWDSITGINNLPVNLRLPYDLNFIKFSFTANSVGGLNDVHYRYILEGVDRNWSAISNEPYSEAYLNLQPGQYRFKVSSKGFTQQWSPAAEFSFTVLPPWWRTWWAYGIYLLVFVGFVWGIVAWRSTALSRENRILEEKIEHRTLQLKKSLEHLKETQSQLIQSEKMASLGELTAGIAHEIQNPLNFVNNFSEINKELIDELQQEVDKGNFREVKAIAFDIKENSEKINHHGRRADSIVKGMLQYSRGGTGQKEPTDINALAEEYLKLAYHGLRAKDKNFNAQMQTHFDKSIGKVNLIPQEIGRVLLNLYNNAFYAVADKKNRELERYEPTVSVSTKMIDHQICLVVSDNGDGIPPAILAKIFQPFFTTKPAGVGTGLGLSMSYKIILAHGGEIKVESKEGEGTQFIILLDS